MIPYLAFWMMISLAGLLADFLIEKEILSIKWTRKVFCLIGKEESTFLSNSKEAQFYTILFVLGKITNYLAQSSFIY